MATPEPEERHPAGDSSQPLHLDAYRQMLASLFLATLIVALGITGVALLINYTSAVDPPILLAVALFGAVGALFSALMRLYTLQELPQALINPSLRALRNKYLLMYAFTPIVIGFIASVVVYFAILSGILAGDVFPKMQCNLDNGSCDSFVGLFSYGPAEAKDYAKALVLGFVSGFSERLIRDVLHTVDSHK